MERKVKAKEKKEKKEAAAATKKADAAKKKAETAKMKAKEEIEDAALRERIIKIIGRKARGQDGGFIVTFIYENLGEVRLRGKIKWQCGIDVTVMQSWIGKQRKKHTAWGKRITKREAEVDEKYNLGEEEDRRQKEAQRERKNATRNTVRREEVRHLKHQ